MIFNEFFEFLSNNNVSATVIATVLSTHVSELTTSFADNIILPIVNVDTDGDGKADIQNLASFKLKVGGFTINFGKFLITLIRVFIIFLVLFYIKKFSSI
tara:strand:- start:1059 stop:1358 length:300 start_codon:yes stop_codon:yes gene_type:complete